MPANLTPAYLAAEARFRAARTTEEKLAALDEMYATIPKHKGTEKLRADIKRRISKLRGKERRSGSQAPDFDIAREGEGQIVFIGPPNSGKSSLLEHLTTSGPSATSALMDHQGTTIQLIDTPPISDDSLEAGMANLIRKADAVAITLDLADDSLLDQFEEIRLALSHHKIALIGPHTPDQHYPSGIAAKPALIIATRLDLPNATDNLDSLQDLCGDEFTIQPTSTNTTTGLADLRTQLSHLLQSD